MLFQLICLIFLTLLTGGCLASMMFLNKFDELAEKDGRPRQTKHYYK
jgi:hypothetical protein